MSEDKTLYCINLRFHWSRMHKDIHVWIKVCPYCCVTFKWQRRVSELVFLWPIRFPFAIIHLDL